MDGTLLHPELRPEDLRRLEAKLLDERSAILQRTRLQSSEALAESVRLPDEAEQASAEEAQAFELRLAEKDRKLVNLIEHALDKILRGEYGLCEGTDEPIDVRRLEARPWARFGVDYKETLEKERAMHAEH